MRHTWITIVSLSLSALPLAFGCNAVLGNEHGELSVDDAGAATLDGAAEGASDAGVAVIDGALQDATDADPSACGPGKKSCFGQCVSNTDPLYGCAADACVPCAMARASAICAGGACAVGACDPGYSDCNKNPVDGCETDLAQASHCGTCNTVCNGTPTPYCSPSGAGFACSTNCSAIAPTLCGTQCVDLNTSQSHCGDCSTPCPVVANGQEACVSKTCQLACDTNFHVCGGACASNADPATCGTSCTPCVAPANANATCSAGGACGFVCKTGFHNCGGACVSNSAVTSCGATSCASCPSLNATPSCNGTSCGFTCATNYDNCDSNPANACETALLSDQLNCGACGHSCMGAPCSNGMCVVADGGTDAAPD